MIRLGRGAWKGRVLRPPRTIRPTSGRVRAAALDLAGPGWMEGRTVWDLCCGSGAFGLECLGCGAAFGLFVDSSRECVEFVRSALAMLGAGDRGKVLLGDVRRCGFERLPRPDLVFIDPPYGDDSLLSWALGREWSETMAAPGGLLIVESRSGRQVPEGFSSRRHGDTMLCWRWL